MSPLQDNDAFWRSSESYIAESPHRPGDSDGLAEFAASSDATRSLLYFQTSGYADVPKWVGLSREAFLHSARAVNQHLEVTAKDRWLIALPLHHVGGFSILARCHESGAGFSRMEGKWNPRHFVDYCRTERITLVSLVPTQVYDLVRERLEAPPDLRAVVVGGGGLPAKGGYGHDAISLGWPLLQSYGMTEAASQIATEPLAHLQAGFDPEDLEVLPGWKLETDRNGVLYVRGAALASGYATKRDWRKRKWIAEDVKLGMSPNVHGHPLWDWTPISPDTGLITRDHVELWEHGTRSFLRFLARGSSFVKVLGELVNVDALQPRLEGLAIGSGLGFGKVVVFPLPDERKGARLVLVGQLPMEQLEALRARYNKQSVGCERLDESFHVSALPRTDLGKLDMVSLRRLVKA